MPCRVIDKKSPGWAKIGGNVKISGILDDVVNLKKNIDLMCFSKKVEFWSSSMGINCPLSYPLRSLEL